MPFQKSYTADDGAVHASSFWRVAEITLDYINLAAVIRWNGYKDYSAFSGGKTTVGQKVYVITGSTFTTYYSETALTGSGKFPEERAQAQATATLDTGGSSFFNGASSVDNSGSVLP